MPLVVPLTWAVLIGTIPGGYGFPPLFSIFAGIGVLLFVLNRFGLFADSSLPAHPCTKSHSYD